MPIFSAVDGVAVGFAVAVGEDSAVKADTGSFEVVHVSFDTPNGPGISLGMLLKP